MEIYLDNSFLIQTDLLKLQLVSKLCYERVEKALNFCQVKFESWEEEPSAFYYSPINLTTIDLL